MFEHICTFIGFLFVSVKGLIKNTKLEKLKICPCFTFTSIFFNTTIFAVFYSLVTHIEMCNILTMRREERYLNTTDYYKLLILITEYEYKPAAKTKFYKVFG